LAKLDDERQKAQKQNQPRSPFGNDDWGSSSSQDDLPMGVTTGVIMDACPGDHLAALARPATRPDQALEVFMHEKEIKKFDSVKSDFDYLVRNRVTDRKAFSDWNRAQYTIPARYRTNFGVCKRD
jgi:hypothetical protein